MLLTNGVYALDRGDGVTLLRFYDDGRLISLSVGKSYGAGTVAEWLRWEDRHPAKGRYAVQGQDVSFAIANDAGVIDYTGVMKSSQELVVDWHSHINGARGGGEIYMFAANLAIAMK